MSYRAKPFAEVFWRNVDRRGPDECWRWKRSRQHSGHGQLTRYIDGTPCSARAHRVAWELTFGPIPDGQKVRHQCDNPPCCNPAHLLLGTQADNVADMHERGRAGHGAARGARNARAKLTDDAVEAIRARRAAGALLRDLASEYDVGISQVGRICRGEARVAA